MEQDELIRKLDELMLLPAETEWVEFKEARTSFSYKKLGRYFSALANEANLKQQPDAWLVFGVSDKPREVVGTQYRPARALLDNLKMEIAQNTTGNITFIEIHEIYVRKKRVVLFQIPPAPRGIPIACNGHYYGRHGESLSALTLQEIEQIRNQVSQTDWSAGICEQASIDDLDPAAIRQAKRQFADKQRLKADEILQWETAEFLDRIKITVGGRITHAAILLLGKPTAMHFLLPSVGQITWNLVGPERAYEHFGPPFLLNVEKVYQHIRNIKFKVQPANRLIPIELMKYDSWVVLEAMHNCIAHQDYTRQSRIVITETVDRLILENAGGFFEGTVEDYILADRTPMQYRNPLLAQAMVSLDMIDTMGYGIKRMFLEQKKRFFPLPEYDLSRADIVKVEIMGRIIDENYTRILIEEKDLELSLVVALDKVQKGKPLSDKELKALRKRGLVEGRKPNIFIAAHVAETIGGKADYIRRRAFDDQHYKRMISDIIREFGFAERADIDNLLMDKLSDNLSAEQKKTKIHNLLTAMSKDGLIHNVGSRRHSKWEIKEKI